MRALALDPGALTGYAVGDLGGVPRWGTLDLRGGGSTGETLSRFASALRDLIAAEQPEIAAFESPYVPHLGAEIPRNAATVRRLHCYAGLIEAVSWRLRIRVYEARPSEICLYFTGQGSWGSRERKKLATVRTCLAYGWDVAGNRDAADALALWAYAESIIDPVAASQRKASIGLELDLHGGQKGSAGGMQSRGASKKPSAEGDRTNGAQQRQDIAAPRQLQLAPQ